MSDTVPVTFQVTDLEHIAGRGRVLAIASVEVIIDGVAIVTQGWRVVRRADGWATVEPPAVRHVDGDLIPAVALPPELEDAIGQVILRELAPTGLLVKARPTRDAHHAPQA